MQNYDAWDMTSDFTVAQASCLWCEVEAGGSFLIAKMRSPRIAAIEQMLVSEIRAGRLPADSTQNPLHAIGDYSASLVTREDLKGLAEQKGLKPKFLFASARQSSSEVQAQASRAVNTREASSASAAPDSHSSGFPGRPPKAKHLIEQEFQRRAEEGELCPTLPEEASALLDWLEGAHPTAALPTVKTIKNNLRGAYNRHKQKTVS